MARPGPGRPACREEETACTKALRQEQVLYFDRTSRRARLQCNEGGQDQGGRELGGQGWWWGSLGGWWGNESFSESAFIADVNLSSAQFS